MAETTLEALERLGVELFRDRAITLRGGFLVVGANYRGRIQNATEDTVELAWEGGFETFSAEEIYSNYSLDLTDPVTYSYVFDYAERHELPYKIGYEQASARTIRSAEHILKLRRGN